MSKTKPQAELNIELNIDIKSNSVISGIKLTYSSEKKQQYGVNHLFQVVDGRQLKYMFKFAE